MHLLVSTTGTHGDVQPCVALARGLAEAGHQVQVASVTAFQGLIEEANLEWLPLWEPDPRAVMRDVQRGTVGHRGSTRLFKHLFRRRPPPARALERQVELCRGRDFVLSHISNYLHAAEAVGVPFAFLAAYPTLPTRSFPHHLSRIYRSLGGLLNRLTHVVFRQLFWVPDRHWVNAWRRQLGLPPLGWSGPHPYACRRGIPYLFGYSPALLPRPSDWPPDAVVTGFWFLDTAGSYRPPPALEQFLDAGPAPVVVSFGSLVDPHPAELRRHLVSALHRSGQRGLILAGWRKEEETSPAGNLHYADWVPLPWLLPRVQAIIHHSGAGTSAEALRAGIPSVSVPYSGEQKFWADRLHRLGVAPPPLPRSQLTEAALVERLSLALNHSGLPGRLQAMARRIRSEDGVNTAVEAFERIVAERRRSR